MQYHWLNKQNNKKLIIFFAGWSFDYKPFEFLFCGDFDILMFYDYNNLDNFEVPESYEEINIIGWSMGVFIAYLLKDRMPKLNQVVAINGTPFPVDDNYGIPQKPFLLTLKHAKTGLEGKFYQNIFNTTEEFETYKKSSVQRSIENRVDELNNLYKKIKATNFSYEPFYTKAIISNFDKIIPAKNQINFWKDKVSTQIIDSGHFPYYNYKSWDEILCK